MTPRLPSALADASMLRTTLLFVDEGSPSRLPRSLPVVVTLRTPLVIGGVEYMNIDQPAVTPIPTQKAIRAAPILKKTCFIIPVPSRCINLPWRHAACQGRLMQREGT